MVSRVVGGCLLATVALIPAAWSARAGEPASGGKHATPVPKSTATSEPALTLVAKYDWSDGARDVSGFRARHDGVLDPGASVKNGKLVANRWDGVKLGKMSELDGAAEVLLRFDDVTFTEFPAEGTTGNYAVLAGGGYHDWWVGVRFDLPPFGNRTRLTFNLNGWDHEHPAQIEVEVAGKLVRHFDSIEYRFRGAAPPEERLAIRWNGGKWVTGGWKDKQHFRTFRCKDDVRINDGARADWDPLWATLRRVSFYVVAGTGASAPKDAR